MRSSNFWTIRAPLSLAILAACWPVSFAQAPGNTFGGGNVLNYLPPRKVVAKPGAAADSALPVELRPGYHVNSIMPSDEYLIPLRLTWDKGPLEAAGFTFPPARMEKYSFSDKPLSVYSGNFEIVTHFKAAAGAAPGVSTLKGRLRYQACNSTMCLSPKTLEVSLPVEIVK